MADTQNHTIRRIVISTGVVTTIAGAASKAASDDGTGSVARFDRPTGIWGDASALYVVDSNNHAVRKLTPVVP